EALIYTREYSLLDVVFFSHSGTLHQYATQA
ncbi:MAG: hypothetical protein ACI8ZW_002399, partial [Yoonia sp.]